MRTKAGDVIVDDPGEGMRRFESALARLVKMPKTITRAKHKHSTTRPKKTQKR